MNQRLREYFTYKLMQDNVSSKNIPIALLFLDNYSQTDIQKKTKLTFKAVKFQAALLYKKTNSKNRIDLITKFYMRAIEEAFLEVDLSRVGHLAKREALNTFNSARHDTFIDYARTVE
jgi:DNA-binding CsgD family transcriptional regulator